MGMIFLRNIDNLNQRFLSVGELSELYNISRQTVLYYDKHNLLKPNFIDYNGYRYYHFKEYTKLEIILNLRKIGFSIEQIKEYLSQKCESTLYSLLESKIRDHQKMIEKSTVLINDMKKMQNNLSKLEKTKLNKISYQYQIAKSYIISDLVCKNSSMKKRIKTLGIHNRTIYRSIHFKYFFYSWFILKEDYESGNYNLNRYYCIPANINPTSKNILTMPSGNYLFYSFQGLYQPNSRFIYEKIMNHIQTNNLKIKSNILITSQKNFWLTDSKNNYINTLQICIE